MPHIAGTLSLAASRWPRAALFMGVVAILAGFIGMHVLASSHTQHGPPAVAAGTHATHLPAPTALAHGTAHGAALNPASARPMGSSAPEPPPSCLSAGETGEMSAAHTSCIPAPATAGLSAPPPGTTPVAVPDADAGRHQAVAAYAYVPGSPSPGELSISRT